MFIPNRSLISTTANHTLNILDAPHKPPGSEQVERGDVFAIFLGLSLCTLVQRPPGSLVYRPSSNYIGKIILFCSRLIPAACLLDSILTVVAILHQIRVAWKQPSSQEKRVAKFWEHLRTSAITIQILRNPANLKYHLRPVDSNHGSRWTQLGKSELVLNALAAAEMSLVITKLCASRMPLHIPLAASFLIVNWAIVECVYMCSNLRGSNVFDHDDLIRRTEDLDRVRSHIAVWTALSTGLVPFMGFLTFHVLRRPHIHPPKSKQIVRLLFLVFTIASMIFILLFEYGTYLRRLARRKLYPFLRSLFRPTPCEPRAVNPDDFEQQRDVHSEAPKQTEADPPLHFSLTSLSTVATIGILYTCLSVSTAMAFLAAKHAHDEANKPETMDDLHLRDVLPFPLVTCVLSIWLCIPGFPLTKWTGMRYEGVRDMVLLCNLLSSGLCSAIVMMMHDKSEGWMPEWLNWIP